MNDDFPMVSVVMPCHNEAGFIINALQTVVANDYPADKLEIIVVDGMSTDGTRKLVEEFAENDQRVRILDNEEKIVPVGMNLAIRAAQGEYIIRLDCHSEIAEDYIRQCIGTAQRTGAENTGGYLETVPGADTVTARAIAMATSCQFGVGNSRFRLNGPEQEVDTVPFGTFRREIFEKVGLYDQRLVRNQDIEMNNRIRRAGGLIIISPLIKLKYYNRKTFFGLAKQAFNNGLWNPYTIWLTGGGLSLRHFIPMIFVLVLMVLGAGAFMCPYAIWGLLTCSGLYLITAIIFAIGNSGKSISQFLMVLLAYIIIHIAYGSGSLCAIITIPFRFPQRKKKNAVPNL